MESLKCTMILIFIKQLSIKYIIWLFCVIIPSTSIYTIYKFEQNNKTYVIKSQVGNLKCAHINNQHIKRTIKY